MAENYAQEILPTRAHWVLARLQLEASGRNEAFEFVYRVKLDADAIRTEVDDHEGMIANLIDGPMKPGAHPRIYQDAYLAALREALEIITTSNLVYTVTTKVSSELTFAEEPDVLYGSVTDTD